MKNKPIWIIPVLIIWSGILLYAFPNPLDLFLDNWIIMPIAFLAAVVANATAIGGGFLFVPLFIFAYSLQPLTALKLSLSTQAFGMTAGALGWSREFIIGRLFLIGSVASAGGMILGTLYWQISNVMIKQIFGWVSLFIFVAVILEARFADKSSATTLNNHSLLLQAGFIIATFFGGLLTAWTAIGVGEVVALYLLFVYRLRIETAIATGISVLALDSVIGLILHIDLGGIPYEFLIFTVPAVIIGGWYGARVGIFLENVLFHSPEKQVTSRKKNKSPLRWIFAGVILLDGSVMLIQSYLSK